MIDVSIIIVSWNVEDLLMQCLATLHEGSITFDDNDMGKYRAEIIIVDSASHDSTVQRVRDMYPHVILLAQDDNVGFTKGNNIGLREAHGRHLFLLNPDTEIVGDVIPRLIEYLDENEAVGIVGPHTLNTDGTTQSSKRRFHNRMTGFFESTWLQPFAPKTLLQDFYAEDIADDAIAPVDWVQGSALMARREVYEQIGGLDEGYIMYSEEMDWCKQAKDAGWQVYYVGDVQIIHHGGKSSDQAGAWKHIHFQKSKLRYFRKTYGNLFAQLLRTFLFISYSWQLIVESLKGLLGHKREMRVQRMRVYWQVLRSGLQVT